MSAVATTPAALGNTHLVQPAGFDAFMQARQRPTEPVAAAGDEDAKRASRMVSAFKIIGGGLGTGIVMSLLFGSPPLIAIGLSFAIGLAQHFVAERIFKGNDPASKKIVDFCGKLVSDKPAKNEKGLTHEDKSVASVWGAVTAATAVLEAFANMILARKEKQPAEIRKTLVQNLEGAKNFKFLYEFQLKGFDWKENLVKNLKNLSWIKELTAKTAGTAENGLMRFIKQYKKPLTILALIPVSWASGYLQGITASKLAKHTMHAHANPKQ